MKIVEIIFWVSLGIVFYTYLGYGIILYILVRLKELFANSKEKSFDLMDLPPVTLLIAAYNEEDIVEEKMANTAQLTYPAGKLNIIWITDGSTDRTNERLAKYKDVEVLFEPKRAGKTAALNRAIFFVKTPLVIFTDANTMLNNEAVIEIAKAFNDKKVGCVAGEKRIASKEKESASSGGEGIYWKYESFLKNLDSRLNSAVGAAGELFAVRTELFEPMEQDTLLDDFILSMRIAAKGFKISYCSTAYAVEEGTLNMQEERKRKIRISAGGLQSVYRLSPVITVFKTPLLWFQYISHRVLRWTVTPLFLFALLPLNVAIVINGGAYLYIIALSLQILFYILAIIGVILEEKEIRNKVVFVPYYFLFMNYNVFNGALYLFRKKRGDGTWEKSKRQSR